ncbi:MAG: flagellar biosynthesis protein FlhA [Nitrospinae bacterium]|nr:flagellar biosynthesis protein FlhA [Nitrospinota bacterium]
MAEAKTGVSASMVNNADIGLAIGVVGILGVMVVPVPTILLDILLSVSITAGLILLLVTMYIKSPLSISSFPSLLLILTIYRLALNVATTRSILLYGDQGFDAAGKVVEAFGQFVVGGNYAVGIVIFVILVLVNLRVITHGSTRIAEVAARFTLDAMPGKQMSIDADLNAGMINETEARARRKELEDEASFFGAMDGALKFVRGDAVAGIIITLVNIIAGFAIGVLQAGMPLAEAASVYTILTIGDGLVSQIPSLLISTAAGLIVTRSASQMNLGSEMLSQMLVNPRAFAIAAGFLISIALVPGMPTVSFMGLGIGSALLAWYMTQDMKEEKAGKEAAAAKEADKPAPERVEALLPLDTMELEIGYELIPLVDSTQDGELLERIKSVRRQFALEMGIIVPPLHIRDNLQLKSNEYQILIRGVEVARGELWMNHYLAINSGAGVTRIPGVETRDPTFGLPALWVTEANKEKAKMSGYTVVDTATVITTHIKELIRTHAHELLGRQETQALIDTFKETSPKVVEELIPGTLSLGRVQKVLQNLLREQVSIRDLNSILESLADHGDMIKDPDVLTEYVRAALSRQISKQFRGADGTMRVVTLEPSLEETVMRSVKQTDHGSYLALDPNTAQALIEALQKAQGKFDLMNATPILLTGPGIRPHIRRLTERFLAGFIVLSHNEVSAETKIENLSVVSVAAVAAPKK